MAPFIKMDVPEFATWVLEAFSFLLTDYEFCCTEQKPDSVSFENETVELRVTYYTYEVDIHFCHKKKKNERNGYPYSLYELMKFKKVEEEEKFNGLMADKAKSVQFCVNKLAELTFKYATDFLQGDLASYQGLAEFAAQDAKDYTDNIMLTQVREKVAVAWGEKDYARVVKFFEPVQKKITSVERQKLEYCRKKLKEENQGGWLPGFLKKKGGA
jgi:hypothetical protein